jgi:hypothetical protein
MDDGIDLQLWGKHELRIRSANNKQLVQPKLHCELWLQHKNIKLWNLLQFASSNMGTPNPKLHESNLEFFWLELSTCAYIILTP